jgi:hypothetical protein
VARDCADSSIRCAVAPHRLHALDHGRLRCIWNHALDLAVQRPYDADALIERLRQARPAPEIYLTSHGWVSTTFHSCQTICYGRSLSPGVRALRKSTVGAALPTKEETMIRTLTIAAVSAAVLMFSPAAFAQQTGGTADEAKAMLMKAAAAVRAGAADLRS